jgi:hypothetical protein
MVEIILSIYQSSKIMNQCFVTAVAEEAGVGYGSRPLERFSISFQGMFSEFIE